MEWCLLCYQICPTIEIFSLQFFVDVNQMRRCLLIHPSHPLVYSALTDFSMDTDAIYQEFQVMYFITQMTFICSMFVKIQWGSHVISEPRENQWGLAIMLFMSLGSRNKEG
jgi:hypothetical protein